jgi:hypothetical protein
MIDVRCSLPLSRQTTRTSRATRLQVFGGALRTSDQPPLASGGAASLAAVREGCVARRQTLLPGAGNQTCSYMHDDMSRIASANCGSPWAQTFMYDAFGNISKSGTISFQPSYSYLTNQMTQAGAGTDSGTKGKTAGAALPQRAGVY